MIGWFGVWGLRFGLVFVLDLYWLKWGRCCGTWVLGNSKDYTTFWVNHPPPRAPPEHGD